VPSTKGREIGRLINLLASCQRKNRESAASFAPSLSGWEIMEFKRWKRPMISFQASPTTIQDFNDENP
jgi:hypothetical protein